MSLSSRRELLAVTTKRYQVASRKQRFLILCEFVAATGYERNYAISLLCHPPAKTSAKTAKGSRAKTYGEESKKALEKIWQVAGGICGKRLVPLLPELIASLERFGEIALSDPLRERLLALSPATCDRLLASARAAHSHGLCSTKPTPHLLLRSQIPIRTFADWTEDRPGFLEVDLVAHCGQTVQGNYAFTLTTVDVYSGWTLCAALPSKSAISITVAMDALRKKMPFPTLGIDTDNGGEFINHNLVRYCQENRITMTRCRPYKKNDQCHVEQKNGNVVRSMAGYGRYEGDEALTLLGKMHRKLSDYQNFFQPSMKLLTKKRDGAKVTKTYDAARTPAQRLMATEGVSQEVKDALKQRQQQLNPASLHRDLLRMRQELRRLAADYIPEMDQLASLWDRTQEDLPNEASIPENDTEDSLTPIHVFEETILDSVAAKV